MSADRFEFERLVSIREYQRAAEFGVALSTRPGSGALVKIETGMLLSYLNRREEAAEWLALAAKEEEYVSTISVYAAGLSSAYLHTDRGAYREWIARTMPGGPEKYGHEAVWFLGQLRFVTQGRILDILAGNDGTFVPAMARVRALEPDIKLGSYDRTMQAVYEALLAHAQKDRQKLSRLAGARTFPGRLAAGLLLELERKPEAALATYRMAQDVMIDGEYHAIVAYRAALVARGLGREALVARNCEVILKPRVLSPYFGAVSPYCKLWVSSVQTPERQ